MVGIGYCEFDDCRARTNNRFCRNHDTILKRERARDEKEEVSLIDYLPFL